MSASVFRKKSLDRVSSPEQLNDYIRVSNPSVWMILSAVAALLVGLIVWSATGTLETKIAAVAAKDNGAYVCYLTLDDVGKVHEDMLARVGGEERRVASVSATPVSYETLSGTLEDFVVYRLGAAEGDWLYAVTLSGEAKEDVADAEIVLDAVSPISFILN